MGASSRLRSLQYIPALESKGFEVFCNCLFDDRYLEDLYRYKRRSIHVLLLSYFRRLCAVFSFYKYDVIWIEYEVFPYLPAFVERLLSFLSKPYVVDYDDAVFHNYDQSSVGLVRYFLGRKIDVVMRKSACVIAGNRYIAEHAARAGADNVVIVPTVVDFARYRPRHSAVGKDIVIGWIGSPSTQHYLLSIRRSLINACRLYGAKLMLVGADSSIKDSFPEINVEIRPWSEDSEAEMVSMMDVGIMPLLDAPWEKGKCGYKLIQYMASSVPVIASPVGVNVEIVTDSQCGFLAVDEGQWDHAFSQLLSSFTTRERMGRLGRAAVERYYSLQVQAPVLIDVFQKAFVKGGA